MVVTQCVDQSRSADNRYGKIYTESMKWQFLFVQEHTVACHCLWSPENNDMQQYVLMQIIS